MYVINFYYLIRSSTLFTFFFSGELVTGLIENKLHYYSHLLTGYIRCPMFLKRVADIYKILKEKNSDLIFGNYLFYKFIIFI